MQPHFADAIPRSLLKREQDRIDAHYGDYADARAHLHDTVGPLATCADIYTRCDDTNRSLTRFRGHLG